MKTIDFLKFIQEQIHTTVVATNNDQGLPVTCAIDIMDYDENGLYFLTAKGKNFYKRLKANGYLSLTGIKGNNTMSCIAVSVCGKVKEIGSERLQRLLDKNPYMYEIYPTEQSRSALTVFCLYEGQGEWFDLSKKPIERFSFSFGEGRTETDGCKVLAFMLKQNHKFVNNLMRKNRQKTLKRTYCNIKSSKFATFCNMNILTYIARFVII